MGYLYELGQRDTVGFPEEATDGFRILFSLLPEISCFQ